MTEEKKQDETIPGGRYIQGENYINANGEIIGKVTERQIENDNPVPAPKPVPENAPKIK